MFTPLVFRAVIRHLCVFFDLDAYIEQSVLALSSCHNFILS